YLRVVYFFCCLFFFQAEDGIRDRNVTGVQTCALPIFGLDKDLMIDLLMFSIPIAILFARIYYVIFEWEQYASGPWWKPLAIWEGGIAIHGALIGAVLTAIVFARVKKVSFWQIADIAAPSLILGQAIGRWGNFMNQEAHGGVMSEAAYQNLHQYLPDFIMNQM